MPDPEKDQVAVISYIYQSSSPDAIETPLQYGVLINGKDAILAETIRIAEAEFVDTELELLNRIVDVTNEIDPDILIGWEMQAASWGYLQRRSETYGCQNVRDSG